MSLLESPKPSIANEAKIVESKDDEEIIKSKFLVDLLDSIHDSKFRVSN